MGLDLILDFSRFLENVEIVVDEVDCLSGNDMVNLIGDSMNNDEWDMDWSDVMEETAALGKDNEVTGCCDDLDLIGDSMNNDEWDMDWSDVMEETVVLGKDNEVTGCDVVSKFNLEQVRFM